MNEAMQWAEEESRAKGTEWTLLWALAKRAVGCVAQCTAEQAIREGRLSRSELYRVLLRLESIREVERLSKVGEKTKVRTFHLPKLHLSQGFSVFSPLCPRKQRPVPDLRDRRQDDRENCLMCRGTGWKVEPRPDGRGEMAVRCVRHIVQPKLLEMPEPSWAPAITRGELEWRSAQFKSVMREPLFEAARKRA